MVAYCNMTGENGLVGTYVTHDSQARTHVSGYDNRRRVFISRHDAIILIFEFLVQYNVDDLTRRFLTILEMV